MKISSAVFAFFATASAFGQMYDSNGGWAQEPNPLSPNRCADPLKPFSRWSHMGVNSVDKPIEDFDDLIRFLAPSGKVNGANVFDRPWQRVAREQWGFSDQELWNMWNAALQGNGSNWVRTPIPPCMVFEDAMLGIPARALGMRQLADWDDRKPKEAWVWQVNDRVKFYLFVGCANPAYQVVIPTPAEHPKEVPIKEKPVPPPPPVPEPKIITVPVPQAPSAPSNQQAGAWAGTIVNVNTGRQERPPLRTIQRSSPPANIPSHVVWDININFTKRCEGKACEEGRPSKSQAFRNIMAGVRDGGVGTGAAAFGLLFPGAYVDAAKARRPDVFTISSPVYTNTFNPANTNTVDNRNDVTNNNDVRNDNKVDNVVTNQPPPAGCPPGTVATPLGECKREFVPPPNTGRP